MAIGEVVREATASTFLVRREGGQVELALVWHPRLECWLPAGGHVEDGETIAAAAVREAREETGRRARLLALPLPVGFPHVAVPGPWWTVEIPACADNHTPVEHVHVDHVFVAEDVGAEPDADAECVVRWFGVADLTRGAESPDVPDISEDSRLQGLQILAHLQAEHMVAA